MRSGAPAAQSEGHRLRRANSLSSRYDFPFLFPRPLHARGSLSFEGCALGTESICGTQRLLSYHAAAILQTFSFLQIRAIETIPKEGRERVDKQYPSRQVRIAGVCMWVLARDCGPGKYHAPPPRPARQELSDLSQPLRFGSVLQARPNTLQTCVQALSERRCALSVMRQDETLPLPSCPLDTRQKRSSQTLDRIHSASRGHASPSYPPSLTGSRRYRRRVFFRSRPYRLETALQHPLFLRIG